MSRKRSLTTWLDRISIVLGGAALIIAEYRDYERKVDESTATKSPGQNDEGSASEGVRE